MGIDAVWPGPGGSPGLDYRCLVCLTFFLGGYIPLSTVKSSTDITFIVLFNESVFSRMQNAES